MTRLCTIAAAALLGFQSLALAGPQTFAECKPDDERVPIPHWESMVAKDLHLNYPPPLIQNLVLEVILDFLEQDVNSCAAIVKDGVTTLFWEVDHQDLDQGKVSLEITGTPTFENDQCRLVGLYEIAAILEKPDSQIGVVLQPKDAEELQATGRYCALVQDG
ncbi:hypothetical protein E1162_18980 [Rhodobacteraceae bacterium RKSG542]|uniref:hypothetical protein n=1 Tax=Pseudovibrio flavus TaxID=2529854 RepID=UPI0012BBF37B|nr:hypothetical protein [Pseudovibrio flavus]MTI19332.1 hypothetical protein [Pseudovibrio flavus]